MLIFFQRGDDSYVFVPLVPFFFCIVLVVFVLGAALKKLDKKIINIIKQISKVRLASIFIASRYQPCSQYSLLSVVSNFLK